MMAPSASELTELCVRILFCFFGISGNLALLFYSRPRINCKNEAYKILLFNLAVSNLLTNFLVSIPGILVEASGTWFLGNSYCKIFWFITSLSVTSSILTTLVISMFWFWKLVRSRPTRSVQTKELQLMKIYVFLGWIVAIVFSAPFLYFCNIHEVDKEKDGHKLPPPVDKVFACYDSFPSTLHKHMYELVYLLIANALPILVMLFTNLRTVIVLIKNRKRISALKCLGDKRTSLFKSSSSKCKDVTSLGRNHQPSKTSQEQVKEISFKQSVSCVSTATSGLGYLTLENTDVSACVLNQHDRAMGVLVSHIDRRMIFQPVREMPVSNGKHEEQRIRIQCDSFVFKQEPQQAVLYNLNTSHLVLIPDSQFVCVDEDREQSLSTVNDPNPAPLCPERPTTPGYPEGQLPAIFIPTNPAQCKAQAAARTRTKNLSAATKIRATISIASVVGVFFIFWVIHLALRIKVNTGGSQQFIDIASLIASSYTAIIPYIFLYGMKKCPCGRLAYKL